MNFSEVSASLQTPVFGLNCETKFRLALHMGPPRYQTVEFLDDGVVEFGVAASHYNQGSMHMMMERLPRIRALFARAQQLDPGLRGKCDLWLADVPEIPCLAFSGNSASHVLIPDSDFVGTAGYRDLAAMIAQKVAPWRSRSAVVFWRGQLSGNPDAHRLPHWSQVPRGRMCLELRNHPASLLFDVGIVGRHYQVHDPQQRDELAASGLETAEVPFEEFLKYRALIDIDGNSSAWSGLFSKLLMGSTVIKVDGVHGYRQWCYSQLKPWKNFIPATKSMVELVEIARWIHANEDQAEGIASEGLALARGLTFELCLEEGARTVIDFIRSRPPLYETFGRCGRAT